jgi:hypothetical protein
MVCPSRDSNLNILLQRELACIERRATGRISGVKTTARGNAAENLTELANPLC